MNTLVSVVIPYYNRASTLERTLRSLWEQTYRPLQVLLVDNGSTDGSEQLARRFQENHHSDSFQVISLHEERPGAAAARNKGLAEASGCYVYFFDSDDEMSPDFISQAVAMAETHDCEVVAAVTTMIAPSGRSVTRRYGYSTRPSRQILSAMLSTQALFLQTAFLRSLGGWNAQLPYWNDWELGVRILLAKPRLRWIKKRSFHRIYLHDDSITGNSFHSSLPLMEKAVEAVRQLVVQSVDSEKAQNLRALFFREAIVAGHLYREQAYDAVTACRQWASRLQRPAWERLVARVLYRYTALGGRGAWRVAAFFC